MICPICNLELESSRKVLGLTHKGIKEFHLANAHTYNLLHDLVNLVNNMSFHHRELGKNIPFGDVAVVLNKYAKEIQQAETEKWEGEE
jgi:hypothetical protein